jgi:hypothetical protein
MEDRRPKTEIVGELFGDGCELRACSCWKRCGMRISRWAVSSRGLGHGPLKAGTRVRIPLPLSRRKTEDGRPKAGHGRRQCWPYRLSVRTAPFQGAETGSTPVGATLRRVLVAECGALGAGCGVRNVLWGRSSVWLEHPTVTRKVAGSNPVAPVCSWSTDVAVIALVVKLVDTPS